MERKERPVNRLHLHPLLFFYFKVFVGVWVCVCGMHIGKRLVVILSSKIMMTCVDSMLNILAASHRVELRARAHRVAVHDAASGRR